MEEKSSEEQTKKKRLPRGIPFILGNMLLERYSYTGITAILALYLHRKLEFDEDASTAIYHTVELLAYTFPIIADSWLGNFKTIAIMLGVFAIGTTTIAVTSIESLSIPLM